MALAKRFAPRVAITEFSCSSHTASLFFLLISHSQSLFLLISYSKSDTSSTFHQAVWLPRMLFFFKSLLKVLCRSGDNVQIAWSRFYRHDLIFQIFNVGSSVRSGHLCTTFQAPWTALCQTFWCCCCCCHRRRFFVLFCFTIKRTGRRYSIFHGGFYAICRPVTASMNEKHS